MNDVTILIAEDDEGHAYLIKRNLVKAGVTNPIMHFFDGEQLLEYLYSIAEKEIEHVHKSFVLLLDIRMPKIDGIEVLKRIRCHERLQSLPVIILTTADDPREKQRCHTLGCSSYMTKPMDYESFVSTIKQLSRFINSMPSPELN
ncbi:MAG: response regulator [Candidatus Auribacterota bacterium]|nr:response regulator [Candidatus Auribacterota bacterium]